MFINLRGGLGNQILQLSYVLSHNKTVFANTNAVKLRDQLYGLDNVKFVNSKVLNYTFGGMRKLINSLFRNRKDFKFLSFCDGYFQYGDITHIIHQPLMDHLQAKLTSSKLVEKYDLVIHIRAGDYFKKKSMNTYSLCDERYYLRAIERFIERNKLNESRVLVISNDLSYSRKLIEKVNFLPFSFEYKSFDEWTDFSILALAKNAIIPNSTFSLTARMILSDGCTIAPVDWFTSQANLKTPFIQNFEYV